MSNPRLESVFVVEEGVEGEGIYTLAICASRRDADGVMEVLRRVRSLSMAAVGVTARPFDTPESFAASLRATSRRGNARAAADRASAPAARRPK